MLQVKGLEFSYDKEIILKNISLEIDAGEHVAIIGESGSGKSTLLKLLYGEFDLTRGEVYWKNQQILGPKFNLVIGYDFMKRVTQEFDLMPFTTVEDNIGHYLSRFYPEEKQRRTDELIKVVELEAFANVKVKTLSGGQKQRVALARALAKEPEILLLDEPFSHIDSFKKQSLRRNVFNYLRAKKITCVVATHHKDDVLGFADRLFVLHDATFIATDTPQNLYNNPQLPFIASFFGEFSVINDNIYYAHQLRIVDKSNLNANVKQSYYDGNSWLIEAVYDAATIFINHPYSIAEDQDICFQIIK